MSKPLSEVDARTMQTIIDDAVMRMDALAERGGYSVPQVRGAAVGGLALRALQAGQCRGQLLAGLDTVLEGSCVCEIETKGNA